MVAIKFQMSCPCGCQKGGSRMRWGECQTLYHLLITLFVLTFVRVQKIITYTISHLSLALMLVFPLPNRFKPLQREPL